MLFRQLEYFVAVARERHFARAAESCYVSQPALSAAIAKLERELNVTLITKDSVLFDLREYCRDNNLPLPTDPIVAFRYWLEWNGIVGYADQIRDVLFDLVTSDMDYLITTDAKKEAWLKSIIRPGERS